MFLLNSATKVSTNRSVKSAEMELSARLSALACLHLPDSSLLSVQYDAKRICELSERLVDRIMAECPMVIRNGDADHMYPGR